MTSKLSYALLHVLFIFQILNCHIASAETYFEDINVLYYNEDYLDKDTFDVSINYRPNGQNTISIRVDIIKDIPNDIRADLNTSMRSFGRIIPFGVSMKGKVCDPKELRSYYDLVVREPFGINICPPNKGTYELENFKPDLTMIKLPALIGATIMIDLELFTATEKFVYVKLFLTL